MFSITFPSGRKVVPALIVVDMQNGFVSKGGSYDKLGMNTSNYREIIPNIKDLIQFCRTKEIPIFYTEAVREDSGIDLLTKVHNFLPKSRQERLKFPICIRGTWDGVTIDELKPRDEDHVVIKRRDSAFQDTELRVWLQSEGVNLLILAGIDTSICVETSLRDGFNLGYDVILISDATASGNNAHYKTTLERVSDYYGLVMSIERFKKAISDLDKVRKKEVDLNRASNTTLSSFLKEFNLLDPRTFALANETEDIK
ncbi:MAG: cysteine hydrolase [Candidatus Nitrosocosmicus sp.]|nr:cysteine hydrolase [Candidatus Nitrosocosmicus sp.]MDN5868197.1 cysteine hydrolase [Candidatus Nitrosocosmicus sp.]